MTSGEGRVRLGRVRLGRARFGLALFGVVLATLLPSRADAHAVLRAGDVVVVGIATADAGGPGRLYVAFLAPLHVDGELRFTDDGRRADGTFRRSEGTSIVEAVRMPIARGTVLSIDVGTMSLASRDQVAIYEGRIDDTTGVLSGGALVFQASWAGPFTSSATSDAEGSLDPALASSGNVALLSSAAAYEYVGRTSGTRAEILAQVRDPAFWRTTTRAALAPPSSFSVTPVRGEPCSGPSECPSGLFCVDDVCCETSCGGGSDSDCITCDFGATPETGTCGVAPPEHVCRFSAGYCDLTEQCDGVSGACPPDGLVPGGFVCRPVRDLCDVAEYCDGTSRACPLDAFAGPERLCRDAVDACDVAEYCDGALACPSDVLGCFDAGPPMPDAGVSDAGGPDAGADGGGVDAGERADASALDVGVLPDADAPTDAAPDAGAIAEPSPGCSCRTTAAPPRGTLAVVGLAMLLGLAARRR